MTAWRKWLRFRCLLFTLTGVPLVCVTARSQTDATAGLFSPEQWKSSPLPFAFKYIGKESSAFLSDWRKSEETLPSPGGQLERQIFTDTATGLRLTAEVRTFKDYNAVEWVLKLSNQGTTDTPIIEDIEPLLAKV